MKNRRRCHPHAQINQADPCGTPEVLERFQAAMGVGRVAGPVRAAGRVDLYRWEATSHADVSAAHAVLCAWLCNVKRAQFHAALGVDGEVRPEPSRDELLAWAAGLFEGDGSTCLAKHRTHEGHVTADVSITQASSCGLPEVLTRFKMVMGGVGRTYGPYAGRGHGEPIYRYKALRFDDADHVLRSLWPWLGSTKRVQAMSVIALVRSQAQLPRGNPAWGHHKTHCVHGHEYATARIHRYVPHARGTTERRASKQCLVCVRERARRQKSTKEPGGRRRAGPRYLLK